MTNLDIQSAYLGLDPVDRVYLGTDVVWQPASSGSLLELVWDNTPGWYEPDPQNPAFSIDKARFRPYFNGEPLSFDPSQLDTPWFVNINGLQPDKWIKIPTAAENLQDEWIELEWINGGNENQTVSSRNFEVVVTYSGYSASTTIDVEASTGQLDFGGAIGQFGPNQAIAMSVSVEIYDGYSTTTIPIANPGNNYNFGTWTYSADTPGDFAYIGYDGWDGQNNTFMFRWNRTGGTGNTAIYMYADWCGFPTSAVLQVSEPVDPMVRTPLTLEVTDTGTTAQSLYFRYSGGTSAYTKNIVCIKNSGDTSQGGWTREINMTGGTYASRKIDVLIDSGMSVGDKYEFFGMYNGYGGLGYATSTSSTSPNAIEYFVNTAGLRCKVYGNINSLLTDSTFITDFNSCDFTMNDWAFSDLFAGKTGFTFDDGQGNHLVLPSTSLSRRCYRKLFAGCTSMTSAPELPATTLNTGCYNGMFSGCTGLVNPPALPATTLTETCYVQMFDSCTSLQRAPELPASTYATNAYLTMFRSCSSLNYVKCLLEGTEIDIDWLRGASSTGTFVKHPDATWVQGTTGRIPTGWTIEDYVEPNP